MHRPSALRGAALLTASIILGAALGVSQLYALVLFGLPFVLVVGGVLGRVGFHAERFAPRRFRASSS